MNRTVSQVAKILGVDNSQVKKWAYLFKDYLSGSANPPKGRVRGFYDTDVLVLCYVCEHWEPDPDFEAIKIGLNREDFQDERLLEFLYLHSPLLQEPPEDLDETWKHGVFLNGATVEEFLQLARSFRQGAEALLDSALSSGEPREWGYPILFAYRHTLELYLKIIGKVEKPTHSLRTCVTMIERRYKQRIGSPVREWILELDNIDPFGTAFRYADDDAGTLRWAEYWIDFGQFKFAMGRVFEVLDAAIFRIREPANYK